MTKEQQYISDLLGDFKNYVIVGMSRGDHEKYPDHFDYIKDALKEFEQAVLDDEGSVKLKFLK